MRTVAFLAAMAISLSAFAAQGSDNTFSNNEALIRELKADLNTQSIYSDQDLNGDVVITFSVDANDVIHVSDVESKNMFLENHAIAVLNNKMLHCDCPVAGQSFEIRIDYIQIK